MEYKVTKYVTNYGKVSTVDLGIHKDTDIYNAIYAVKDIAGTGQFVLENVSTKEETAFVITGDRCFEVVNNGVTKQHVEV